MIRVIKWPVLALLALFSVVFSDAAFAGGGCYTSYTSSCMAGYTNQGSLGTFGACINSADPHHYRYSPPGAGCSLGVVGIGSWNYYSGGTAVLCCKS